MKLKSGTLFYTLNKYIIFSWFFYFLLYVIFSFVPNDDNSTSPSRNDSVRRYRKPDDKKEHLQSICTDDLILWGFQVARGMEFLSQRKVI